jgi:hypothetical protein
LLWGSSEIGHPLVKIFNGRHDEVFLMGGMMKYFIGTHIGPLFSAQLPVL